LLNLLTALSLLLCVAVVALGVRSYWVADELRWTRADNVGRVHYRWYATIVSSRGGLAICQDAEVYELASITPQEAAAPTGVWLWSGWKRRPADAYPTPAFSMRVPPSGFHIAWQTSPGTVLRELIVPYWSLAFLTAVLPAAWLTRSRRNRSRAGLCTVCGYDLRATPGRCPECGSEYPAGISN
jgi:hypothetical protein